MLFDLHRGQQINLEVEWIKDTPYPTFSTTVRGKFLQSSDVLQLKCQIDRTIYY